MGINVEWLRTELEFVTANPDKYEPDVYAAKTETGVVADLSGWTCIHAGLKPQYKPRLANRVVTSNGSEWIWEVAIGLLGLPMPEGARLLRPGMSVDDLWRVAAELTDGAIQAPTSAPAAPDVKPAPKRVRKAKVALR